jgi:hypothetical protein
MNRDSLSPGAWNPFKFALTGLPGEGLRGFFGLLEGN